MPVQFGGGCYEDNASAASALAAAALGTTYPAGSAVYTVTGAVVSGESVTLELSDLLSSLVVTKTVTPPFAPCSLLDWRDGLELGWGVGLALILTGGCVLMARARKVAP